MFKSVIDRMRRMVERDEAPAGDYGQLQSRLDGESVIRLEDLVAVSGGAAQAETMQAN
jgi:hypothetical protein